MLSLKKVHKNLLKGKDSIICCRCEKNAHNWLLKANFYVYPVIYFLNLSTSDLPFLKILLLANFPFLKAFCSSKGNACISLQ